LKPLHPLVASESCSKLSKQSLMRSRS